MSYTDHEIEYGSFCRGGAYANTNYNSTTHAKTGWDPELVIPCRYFFQHDSLVLNDANNINAFILVRLYTDASKSGTQIGIGRINSPGNNQSTITWNNGNWGSFTDTTFSKAGYWCSIE